MDDGPDDESGDDAVRWRPWAAAFFLYVASVVAWLWVFAVARLGRPDVAAAVAVGWVVAVVAAIAALVRARRARPRSPGPSS